MLIGYYIFLGNGDYHQPQFSDINWTQYWVLENWKVFVDQIASNGAKVLMIYLNGHYLPYSSDSFPELVDKKHPNVENEFLVELLQYIKSKGMMSIAVITTSGHAAGFLEKNQQLAIEIDGLSHDIEECLVSFPEHLRKGKITKVAGKAQLGRGVLCHNKPDVKVFVTKLTSEILSKFGDYVDGVAFHPPESIFYCGCPFCCSKYSAQNCGQLIEASFRDQRKFFITSYLEFQLRDIFPLANNKKLFTFTIPWLFESQIETILASIPLDVTIIDWDYNLEPSRVSTVAERIQNYRRLGHKVWFMPTGGFSFDANSNFEQQIRSLGEQVAAAKESKIDALVPFLGPRIPENFKQISSTNFWTVF